MSAVANFLAFRSREQPTQRRSLYPRPLDFPSFEVRLLTLLPPDGGNENDDGSIHCTLKYDFLIERNAYTGDTLPISEYVALSYCWGDPFVRRLIFVNNIPVEVTTNLEAALRALRDMKIEVLWIDALCINQEDLLERGLQVMRMGLIYSNAVKVLAWIGEKDYYSERAMNYLHVEARAQAQGGLGKNIHISEYHAESVSALLRRPYWKRVWVIQEISKGREVHVVCGS
ncbi:HET-domain-containing protein [Hyaloscypha variabilis F]|uniref:HET-domain-containing protein n=1 Tax=Hyaloscypha variabilis (strain UAMH 11265 / GT02V1 / F) TaxID=1149755 RepID=A0A2J6RH30_HYAVF|nr:HET-domain-containing protein [Hyaloscypha variabilis F]